MDSVSNLCLCLERLDLLGFGKIFIELIKIR